MEEQLEFKFDVKKQDDVKKEEKIITCKICGCEKTVEELKNTHQQCFQGW